MRGIYQQAAVWTVIVVAGAFCGPAVAQAGGGQAARVRTVTVTVGSNNIDVEIATSEPVAVPSPSHGSRTASVTRVSGR